MNNYIPNEVKDLTESKQRVMRNVVNEIENKSRRPKHKWRYVVITAVLTMSVMLFFLNEIFFENEQQSATELHLDLTKPIFSEEQGLFYLNGITLGDSQSKVIERFGENYTIDQEDDSGADLILDYDGLAKFYFIEDKLDSIVFMNVDENYFDKFFKDYDGFKFIFHWYLDNDNRLFFSKETSHILHASTMSSDGNLYLSLFYAGPDRWEKEAEFLYMKEQNINNQHQSPIDLNIDLTKPTFFEEQDYLYFHGVTLGDSPSKVVEHLGENYIIGQADMSVRGVDFIMDYEGKASFNFYKDKLDSIYLMKIDKNYFDKLFNNYAGLKLIDSPRAVDSDRYFYSKETGQLLKATTNAPNEDLYLYLIPAGKDLLENADFLVEQIFD